MIYGHSLSAFPLYREKSGGKICVFAREIVTLHPLNRNDKRHDDKTTADTDIE